MTAAEFQTWSQFLELIGSETGERRLLHGLLQRFVEKNGLESAALYVPTGDGAELEARVGDREFPASWDKPDTGLPHVSLGPATLVYAGPSQLEPAASAELGVALAGAARVLQLRERLKQQRFEASYHGVELEALYDVGLAIAGTLDLEDLSEEILLRAVSLLDARRGALFLAEGDNFRLERTIGGQAREAIAADDPQVVALLGRQEPDQQDLVPGAEFVLGVPIETDLRRDGILIVADKEKRRGVGPFDDSDRRTLSLFANQAAIALENVRLHRQALEKERLEREMELAADIQRRLLPTVLPALPGYELLGWSRPARHVGGDYYDLLELSEGRVGLVVGDVAGKGIPAALMVSTVHTALRLLVDRVSTGPELLERLNAHISATSAPNKFITFFMGVIDPATSSLEYRNAGHNPAVIVSPGGRVRKLPPGGLPLGLWPDGIYETDSMEMGSGDLLCIYSDGITEAVSSRDRDEEFGAERLVEILRHHHEAPLDDVIREVDAVVSEFSRGLPQGDDQTLLLLRKIA